MLLPEVKCVRDPGELDRHQDKESDIHAGSRWAIGSFSVSCLSFRPGLRFVPSILHFDLVGKM
jgi:hypothetical protein